MGLEYRNEQITLSSAWIQSHFMEYQEDRNAVNICSYEPMSQISIWTWLRRKNVRHGKIAETRSLEAFVFLREFMNTQRRVQRSFVKVCTSVPPSPFLPYISYISFLIPAPSQHSVIMEADHCALGGKVSRQGEHPMWIRTQHQMLSKHQGRALQVASWPNESWDLRRQTLLMFKKP